jgi:thiamine-monophosphate kinase
MEWELIRWLRGRLDQNDDVLVGIGDDAAVLRTHGQNIVVTSDMLMDGVDFHVQEVEPQRIGRKSLAVNLSDLAAMAAQPLAAFVSLGLPEQGGAEFVEAFYEGLAQLAAEFDISIAGGDTNIYNGPLVISITAIGLATPRGVLRRSGAQPGDAIVTTGSFGFSIEGHHFDFTPRVREALLLHERYKLHAGIDVSDGLSLDLWHICEESGCGAILDVAGIPISEAGRHSNLVAGDVGLLLCRALSDGEDFELVLATPPDEAARMIQEQPLSSTKLSRIGEFVAEPGLWLREADGALHPVEPAGYEHKLLA